MPDSSAELTSTMHRLPFTMHDFTRSTWVSDRAREVWEPRLGRITRAWIEIEWLAIVEGIRSCCITSATPEELVQWAPKWARHGLNTLPVAIDGAGSSGDASTPVPVEDGQPFRFRLVVGSPAHVSEFQQALDGADDVRIGALLGFPSCCREFFKRVWVDQLLVDTTWPMAVATAAADIQGTTVEVRSPSKANILWRWMGVRAVPHLPCSFACPSSEKLADQFINVGRRHGFTDEMDWLVQILEWPVEWSALHGIAEIKTPILKVATRTDATPCKYTVRYQGSNLPAESARGLAFPFVKLSLPILTESQGFKRGLNNPIVNEPAYTQSDAMDNGFATAADMEKAHQPIVQVANEYLANNPGNVLDIGCGNGVLLQKLLDSNPSNVPFGIDCEADRIAHARARLPQFAENFVCGNVYNTASIWPEDRQYTLVLLMPGRLLEVAPDWADRLRSLIHRHCRRVLIYAYGEWLTNYGTLDGLAAKAGLKMLNFPESSKVAFADVLVNSKVR